MKYTKDKWSPRRVKLSVFQYAEEMYGSSKGGWMASFYNFVDFILLFQRDFGQES